MNAWMMVKVRVVANMNKKLLAASLLAVSVPGAAKSIDKDEFTQASKEAYLQANIDEPINYWQTFNKWKNQNGKYEYVYGNILLLEGQAEQSIAYFNEAIKLNLQRCIGNSQ